MFFRRNHTDFYFGLIFADFQWDYKDCLFDMYFYYIHCCFVNLDFVDGCNVLSMRYFRMRGLVEHIKFLRKLTLTQIFQINYRSIKFPFLPVFDKNQYCKIIKFLKIHEFDWSIAFNLKVKQTRIKGLVLTSY